MISRSLGPEFGGSIGVIFSIANAVAVALYLVGFAETVQTLMGRSDVFMVDKMNDIRIIGLIALALIFIVTVIGLDWVIHTQTFLLVLLVIAILSVSIGAIYPAPQETRDKALSWGLPGTKSKLFKDNFVPDYRDGEAFFSVFAIFFPAATGIMAGSNLSGDLKDPSKAVPFGTLLAIGITSTSYVLLCWLFGAFIMRDAGGVVPVFNETTGALLNNVTACSASASCEYGSLNDFQVYILHIYTFVHLYILYCLVENF